MVPTVGRAEHGVLRIGWFCALACSLLFVYVLCAPAAAKAIDLTGCYELTVDDPVSGCQWSGPMLLAQANTTITGSLDLTRVAGGAGCLAAVTGTGTGTLTGSSFVFGVAAGGFGTAIFSGTVSADGKSATGTWSSTASASGTWSAESTAFTVAVEMTVKRPTDSCAWTGPATFTVCADFESYTASVALTRVAGGSTCPPVITGTLSGTATGTPPVLSFDLVSAQFGNDHFDGTVSADERSAAGTWSGDAGAGTWSAQFYRAVGAPAMSGILLAALGVLLLAAGVRATRRRRL
jgi:hypothetical protein